MALNGTLMESLLTWVNSLKVGDPIESLSQMQDLNLLLRIVMKLNGNAEETPQILKRSLEERLKYLQRHCWCGSKSEDLVQWEKILQGEGSELEICKVIVLLFYVANMKCKNAQDWETFDHKTQTELAAILRFVLDNEDDLSLDDKLIRFLQRKARIVSSSDSASSSDETLSPLLPVRQTQVRFLELHRVASSSTMKSLALDSPSSPMSEVLHMPQFQIRRLRKQLAEGRELRDELELELSETRKRLAEKEAQIYLMQQRIERLVVLNEKQADQQEPKEMEELREKNESLMIRLRDALKQCQDMKTDRSQLERKNDQLSEENGDLSYKVRDLSSRLAQLQEALNDITEEHEASVSGWRQQHSRLESDLGSAVTEKKCLEEHNQILQGKISILEDQLKMAADRGAQEKGESMGDVLKMEHLQQEVVALNSKSMALQAQTDRLEEEKSAAAASFESQRSRFEYEKLQLQDIVTNLQTSLSEITFQKERQEQESRQQEEKLTCQITTLKLEITKLKSSLAQKDKELASLSQEVEEERRQRGQLAETLQRQEESSKKSITDLSDKVELFRSALVRCQGDMTVMSDKLTTDVQVIKGLQEMCEGLVAEKDSALISFADYRKAKELELDSVGKSLQMVRGQHEADLASLEELKREKTELALKVQELDATILDLIAKCHNLDLENETQMKAHAAGLEALRAQLGEKDAQLKGFKQSVSSMAQVGEENSQMKEQLSSLEGSVKDLNERLESEKRYSASLEAEKERNSILQGELEKIKERSDQAQAELDRERSMNKQLESQLHQLKEELQARTDDLQRRVSSASDVAKLQEEEIEKLTKEMGQWKDRAQKLGQADENLESLQRDHSDVCQRLEEERMKVSELETQAKLATSAQSNRVSELESELSAAKSQLKEKGDHEQQLLHTIHATEEKLRAAQQEEAERVSQLEASCSNTVQDLKLLSKELSEEKLKKEDLEDTLKKLQKQNSEKMLALESEMTAMQATIKQRDGEAEKLSAEVERFRRLLEEVNQKHQQELLQKDAEVSRLIEEKEKAVFELQTEQATKTEVKGQLEKSLDSHKSELSSLQNELSRSLEMVTMKEGEVQRLTKEMSAKEEALHQEKETIAKLSGEMETLKALKERVSAQEDEIERYIHTAKAAEVERTNLRATICEKEKEVQRLESDIKCKMQDSSSIHERYQATVGDVNALKSKIAELESKCREEEDSLNRARKETADAKTAASKMASASEEQQRRIQELTTEIQKEVQKSSELSKQLEDSQSFQAERDSSLEALKKELFHKVQELEHSQKSLNESSKELSEVLVASREQENSLAEARQQIAQYQRDIEKTSGRADSIQVELKNMASNLAVNAQSSLEAKKLLERETKRSCGLENQLKAVQEKLEASSKQLLEEQGTVQSLSAEASSYKEEVEKHKRSMEALQKKLSSQGESVANLEENVRLWQEKCVQKEQQISDIQQQLSNAQSRLAELDSLRSNYAELTAEQTRKETQHKEELLRTKMMAENLQAELDKTKAEVASLVSLKDSLCQKEAVVETFQLERNQHVQQISLLQEDNQKLRLENTSLSQASSKEAEKMQSELAKISEKHQQEMESVRLQYEKMVSEGKEQVQELSQKLEAVASKYDHAKSRVLEERQKFQEEQQKLLAQVEQLEGAKKVQSEQVQELNKKLGQQEKTIQGHQEKLKRRDSEAQEEAQKKQKRLAELEAQLEQQNQVVEHYKAQMEKAKLHYDAKKEQNQELSAELQNVSRQQEQLRKENAEIKMESERLAKELQLSLLQSKEAEQSCKTLTNQVRSLEAQVEFADRQLREQGKLQIATDAMKGRQTIGPRRATRSQADVSIDSLDMSDDDDHPMNSTRKNGRSHQEPSTSGQSVSPDAPSTGRLPRKVESLESLYFTPIPNRAPSKMDTSLGSVGDLSLDSTKKTRSGRRRTTQVINITMTKTTKEEVDTESANTSFYSLRSAPSHQSLQPQSARRGGRPQLASSAPAITSLPSQECLARSERTSSDDSLNNSVLMNLPGYRPNTRSSARLSQAGGRSSFYMSTCQDEPDPQEDWSRIAELQQRNRACPPHLKTSYPLESRPSILSSTITDEEVKTGDPKETLRRATLLPNQIRESLSAGTRRKTLAPTSSEWGDAGVTTRQQVKRVTEESHYGPDTPESKKSASCFPRPMTPKDRPETRRMSTAESKASISQQSGSGRRQSMAFTILSTPKKIGNSLLKRGLNKKTTPKTVSQGRKPGGSASSSPHLSVVRKSPSRRSPRGATAKSPKASKFFERKQSRNK